MVSDKEHAEAEERGRLRSLTVPCAVAARYDPATGMITVDLNRGYSVSFHKSRSQALHNATDEQLNEIDAGPPGWSVFFPKLEDGFTVAGMLAGRFGNRNWERRWADEHQVKIAENTLSEPVYAVMVERTERELQRDTTDVLF
jgi:hypothetical protein